MTDEWRLLANPSIVLREEFEDAALLFDPGTGEGFGLNPVGVFIWKRLDGIATVSDVKSRVKSHFGNVPEGADAQMSAFLEDLVAHGLAGYEV